MHLDISLENSETCHFCEGEGQAFYTAIKNANRKTLLNFACFFFFFFKFQNQQVFTKISSFSKKK